MLGCGLVWCIHVSGNCVSLEKVNNFWK